MGTYDYNVLQYDIMQPLMSMTGYYPHAAQDFHIAGNVVLREIGRIIANLPLNIVGHRAVNINARCVSIARLFSIKAGLNCNLPLRVKVYYSMQ